jgi:hypothetical protein
MVWVFLGGIRRYHHLDDGYHGSRFEIPVQGIRSQEGTRVGRGCDNLQADSGRAPWRDLHHDHLFERGFSGTRSLDIGREAASKYTCFLQVVLTRYYNQEESMEDSIH